jgi:hypothetical protein
MGHILFPVDLVPHSNPILQHTILALTESTGLQPNLTNLSWAVTQIRNSWGGTGRQLGGRSNLKDYGCSSHASTRIGHVGLRCRSLCHRVTLASSREPTILATPCKLTSSPWSPMLGRRPSDGMETVVGGCNQEGKGKGGVRGAQIKSSTMCRIGDLSLSMEHSRETVSYTWRWQNV